MTIFKRSDNNQEDYGRYIGVIFFSCLSILFSLFVLGILVYKFSRNILRKYEYMFVALQLLNFITQTIVIYYESLFMMTDLAKTLMKYFSAINILGFALVNTQTLSLFAALDFRITPLRVRILQLFFVCLFILLTSLELRNLIISGNMDIDKSSSSEKLFHLVGTILIIIFNGVCLAYDNVQAYAMFYLLDQSRTATQKTEAQNLASHCILLRLGVQLNILLNVVDWLGIAFAIIYCAVDPDNQHHFLSAAVITSGIHCSWSVVNFNILKISALAGIKKNNTAKKASSNRTKKASARGKTITTPFQAKKSIDVKQMKDDLETEKCRN